MGRQMDLHPAPLENSAHPNGRHAHWIGITNHTTSVSSQCSAALHWRIGAQVRQPAGVIAMLIGLPVENVNLQEMKERSMIRFLGKTVVVGILSIPAAQATLNLSECASVESSLNKDLPKRADKLTTTVGALCVHGDERPVLLYRMKLDISKSELPADSMNTIAQSQIRGWCTSPSQIRLFKDLDIQYVYFDRTGAYVGEIFLSFKNCPR
jgi:hypothetical protein